MNNVSLYGSVSQCKARLESASAYRDNQQRRSSLRRWISWLRKNRIFSKLSRLSSTCLAKVTRLRKGIFKLLAIRHQRWTTRLKLINGILLWKVLKLRQGFNRIKSNCILKQSKRSMEALAKQRFLSSCSLVAMHVLMHNEPSDKYSMTRSIHYGHCNESNQPNASKVRNSQVYLKRTLASDSINHPGELVRISDVSKHIQHFNSVDCKRLCKMQPRRLESPNDYLQKDRGFDKEIRINFAKEVFLFAQRFAEIWNQVYTE